MTEALSRPVCMATIADNDTVTIDVDGVGRSFSSMEEAIAYLGELAKDVRRPLLLTARDLTAEDGQDMILIVKEDGTLDQEPTDRKRRGSRGVSLKTIQESVEDNAEAGAASESEAAEPTNTHSVDPPVRTAETAPGDEPAPVPKTEEERIATSAEPPITYADPSLFETDEEDVRLRPEAEEQRPAAAAREGWKGWINSTFKTSLSPSSAELDTRGRRSRIQQPLQKHRTAATVELKGGAGKTTTTYHIAATFGRIRGGNILAGEFNENQGTLAERSLPGSHQRSTLDLIRNLGSVTRKTSDLVRYVRPQGDDRIHVLASPPEGADRSRVDGKAVKLAHEMLLSIYSLILLDTGNSAQSSTWQSAVDVADSLVFVAHNREDDCRLLEATVRAVKAGGFGDKLERSILVVSSTAHPNEERLARLKEYAGLIGLAQTVVIPFDPSLQEGRAFDYEALHPHTRKAYEQATAVLADQLAA